MDNPSNNVSSGDFLHLSPAERRKAKARAKSRAEKMRRWQAIRANWTPEMIAEEEKRLEEEVAEFIERRAA